jgi:hypothetical protein
MFSIHTASTGPSNMTHLHPAALAAENTIQEPHTLHIIHIPCMHSLAVRAGVHRTLPEDLGQDTILPFMGYRVKLQVVVPVDKAAQGNPSGSKEVSHGIEISIKRRL